jgi:ABC-type transport system involved in multi-copper enzyme maturation permease subunit
MKGTLAVAAREVAERKLALLGALLAGLLPLAMPLLPGLGGAQARDARFVTAQFLALTITLAFPLVFGATVLVSDITQKRLAFYFSRPLSAASIWAGKLLAALVISVCGACLAAVPTLLFDGKRAFDAFNTSGPATAYFLLTTLVLLVGAHTVSSMARLRSAWIALDFFLAALFAVVIALSLRSLFFAGFWDLYEMKHSPEWLLWWLAAPLIATLLAASYVQVADGRTDARRSHGALSATLRGLMALLALPLAGLAWWVNAAAPKDLVAAYTTVVAPHGRWVGISGPVRARGSAGAAFLYETVSGHFIKRQWKQGLDPVEFSADGARAVWSEDSQGFFERKRTGAFRIASLDSGKPVSIESDLRTDAWVRFVLSPSGRRLAALEVDKVLSVYDLADPAHPKQLVAVRVAVASRSIVFVDDETIRIFPRVFNAAKRKDIAPAALEITELYLPSKKSLVTGRIERDALPFLRISADGRHLVGTKRTTEDPSGKQTLSLRDGRTGAELATLSEDLENPRLRFLSGGRIAVADVADGKGVLKIFLESERRPSCAVELGPAASVVFGGEIAPGRIAVALNPFRSND